MGTLDQFTPSIHFNKVDTETGEENKSKRKGTEIGGPPAPPTRPPSASEGLLLGATTVRRFVRDEDDTPAERDSFEYNYRPSY